MFVGCCWGRRLKIQISIVAFPPFVCCFPGQRFGCKGTLNCGRLLSDYRVEYFYLFSIVKERKKKRKKERNGNENVCFLFCVSFVELFSYFSHFCWWNKRRTTTVLEPPHTRLAARGKTREKRKILAKRWDMKRPKCTPTIKKKSRWEKITTNKNLSSILSSFNSLFHSVSLCVALCVVYKNLFFLFFRRRKKEKCHSKRGKENKKKFLFSLFFFLSLAVFS